MDKYIDKENCTKCTHYDMFLDGSECITEMANAWEEVNGENLVWVPGHYERKD